MTTAPAIGAYYEIGYPFIRSAEDDRYPWQPGCRWPERRTVHYLDEPVGECDAMGMMIINVKGVYTPPGYPTRVFFTREFAAPDGERFGKPTLRCYAIGAFTHLTNGFKHRFELAQSLPEPLRAITA